MLLSYVQPIRQLPNNIRLLKRSTIGIIKLVGTEATVYTPISLTVHLRIISFLVVPKIVFELTLHYPHTHRILNFGFITPLLISRPCMFQCHKLLLLEIVVLLFNEIVEVIRFAHHSNRLISVIYRNSKLFINIHAMPCYTAKFKLNLVHQFVVSIVWKQTSARSNIDQSSNYARLGICDLNRLVRTHKQKAINLHAIGALKLFVYYHFLM